MQMTSPPHHQAASLHLSLAPLLEGLQGPPAGLIYFSVLLEPDRLQLQSTVLLYSGVSCVAATTCL